MGGGGVNHQLQKGSHLTLAAVQSRHLIPAPVNWTSAHAWLYKHASNDDLLKNLWVAHAFSAGTKYLHCTAIKL